MAERASPLAPIDPGAVSDASVTIRQVHFASILQVSAWPDTVQTVNSAIRELLGMDVPQTGQGLIQSESRLAAAAPGRTLIAAQAPDLVTRFEAALPTTEATVTDLSHGRVILRLEGEAEALLAKVVAIDLAPAAFPAGRIAQTTIDHVDVLVHRLAVDSFELWTFRSFAELVADWLLDAGLEIRAAFSR